MSTESPTTPPPAEAPTPRTAVRATWQQFKRGELVSYRVMAVMLLFLAGAGLFVFMSIQGRVGDSKKWLDLEFASSPEDLVKLHIQALTAGAPLRREQARDVKGTVAALIEPKYLGSASTQ